MAVKVRASRPKEESSPELELEEPAAQRPQANRAQPDSGPRAQDAVEVNKPERQATGGTAEADSRTEARAGARIEVTITLPTSSFAPIKYGSFSVPSVAVKFSFDVVLPREEIAELEKEAVEAAKELQERLYREEFETYLRRAADAYDKATKKFGI